MEQILTPVQPQKDLPVQHATSSKPLRASIVIASFGSSDGLAAPLFDLEVQHDPSVPLPTQEKPLRYGKLPEIRHIFKEGPKTPPKTISFVFTLAVAATVPALFVGVSIPPPKPRGVQWNI